MTEAQRENPSRRLRVFTQSPAEFFDEGLRQIEKTRMAGLPILNPKLVVRSAGWRRWGNDWIGVVTTPWAVLGIYACGSREGWVDVPADRTRIIELPAGDFPFRAVEDPILGRCLFLSLKSPLLDVGDQETADLIGKITLDTLFKAQSIPEDDEDAAAWVLPTADGQLRRVIPIRMTPPKNIEATPPLTPPKPEPEPQPAERESFFDKLEEPVSRRELFGRRKKAEPSDDAPGAHAAPLIGADTTHADNGASHPLRSTSHSEGIKP